MHFVYHDHLLRSDSLVARTLEASHHYGYKEVCLSGNRGSGKTIDLALYALRRILETPFLRVVWVRPEYSTIKTSIIETLQYDIFKYPLGDSRWRHPKNPFWLQGGVNKPEMLSFLNGATMRFFGLDDLSKTRGVAADLVILNEGTRVETSAAWGEFGATMSGGRAGRWFVNGQRFNMLVTDTNPSHPFHWIYKLFRGHNPDADDVGIYTHDGKLYLGYTHSDNPLHRNPDGTLNALGDQKVEDLLRYYPVGADCQRMVWSQWAAAEGAVYALWQPAVHEVLMSRDDFPSDTLWHIGVDHGGGPSPFAVSLTGQNGNVFRTYKEFGMSRCTIDAVIQRLDGYLEAWGVPKSAIDTVWADPSGASFNQSLAEAGYPVVPKVDTDIIGGIDSVKQLISEGRYFVNTNSLEARCPFYEGPQGWKEEVLAYQYLPVDKQSTAASPDKPIDRYNHWMDDRRYKLHGLKSVEHISRRTGFIARFAR